MSRRDDAAALLVEHDTVLRAFLGRRAGWLLRHETIDDLVQGVSTRILEHGRFERRTPGEDRAWLYRVARSHLADRIAHWTAARRRGTGLLRITFGIDDTPRRGAVGEPASERTGPLTAARRSELLGLVESALPLLLERDRLLVEWETQSVPLDAQSERLGITYTAAKAARHRAFARLRAAVELLQTRRAQAHPTPL